MSSSLQEQEAAVRALQLFRGDNWFWNRPTRARAGGVWRCSTAGSEPISAGLVPLITAALERGTRQRSFLGKLNPLTSLASALPPPCRGLMNFSWLCLSLRAYRYFCRQRWQCRFLWPPRVARKELSQVKQKKQRNDREPKVFWMPWPSQISLGKIKDQSCILK